MGLNEDINSLTIVGRLVQDIQLEYTKAGFPIGKFSIAVNFIKREQDEYRQGVSFFNVRFMGKAVEALQPYLKKGRRICVSGMLKQDKWQWEGKTFDRIYIQAEKVQLLEYQQSQSHDDSCPADIEMPPDDQIPF